MLHKSFYEMINGVLPNRNYRCMVIVVLILNVLIINHFFVGNTLLSTNLFKIPTVPVEIELPWSLIDPKSVTEESLSTSDSNQSPELQEKVRLYTPTDPTKYPELGPGPTPALISTHDYAFDGPYVGWPLQRLCNEVKQTPGLVFLCDNNSGGVGNIRNFILTCIRYAIEAGASGIVMPKIQRRSAEDLSDLFSKGFQPFYYFFDQQHFKYAMSTYCPQVTVYDQVTDIPNVEFVRSLTGFYPKNLNKDFDGCDERGVNRHLDFFREKFDAWIRNTNQTLNAQHPTTVRFKWATFFEWPIYRDGPEFANTFGDLLRIRPDIQHMAAATIRELSAAMGVPPNPSAIEIPFLGAHLRTEKDALSIWPKFNQQTDGYLEQAIKGKHTHIYLACGNTTEVDRFAERASHKNITVLAKNDLLKGDDFAALQALTWDQQALVDYLVLQKSSFFTGCSFSSFTMNIAVKRHTMTSGIHSRQWRSPGDQYSWLVGNFESWYGDWMFMLECMWP
ncbi:Bgt-1145 [Blumeria graminis f. sp. tritici]|uniref:Bgt-1145 n=2 Tax=Blumeria graminis f. sp. tritici TaxID=62690 RepID=A0A061HRN2_BLUGR|nr:hypothetical protein BGT96224_1145 [Blumeria graminis f. sp. tritici 96224]VDB88882.1 Bgt-1145 [Blumeria graminis f. sp. tritici]